MIRYIPTILLLCTVFFMHAQKKFKYPVASKDSITNIYYKDKIEDPYQWMENPHDPRLIDWLKSQKKFTERQGNKYGQLLRLRNQMVSMQNDTRVKIKESYNKRADSLRSKYQFKYKRKSSKRSPDLIYRLRGKKNYKSLINIKDFQIDKQDNVSVTNRFINEDADLIAIEMSHNGSDWREVYFFNLLTGEQLPYKLENLRARSNIIWRDNAVIYDAFDAPKEGRELLDKAAGQKLFYHKLGQKQSEDKMLYENPDTTGTNSFSFFELKDKLFFKHYLDVRGKTYNALSIANIKPESFYLFKFLVYPNQKDIHMFIEELEGNMVLLNTNWEAPNGRVLRADITQLNKVSQLIPQYDVLLTDVNKLGKDKIACVYFDKGKNTALIFDSEGVLLKTIDFPEGKKLNNFYENEDAATHTDFSISSFYHPEIWYQLSLTDLTFKAARVISVPYDAEDLETRYVNYKSKDGTEIPMYVTCLKKTELNGDNPTLIYGYGGYGITIRPSFDEFQTLFLLHGGVLAIPNIRGGGAKGDAWGKAGRRLNKQTAIDDFIAAAEFLVSEKYTNSNKLAITGGSHGGLLVGAAFTQRPELFKAAIAEAGALDMLRFEKFTVGSVNININEFGLTSNKQDYNNLKSYSPLHNIKEGVKYPNLLLITGADDDRVPPLHSYKFIATLQEIGSKESLYELYVVNGSGHGGALNSVDFTKKITHEYAFLITQLGIRIK